MNTTFPDLRRIPRLLASLTVLVSAGIGSFTGAGAAAMAGTENEGPVAQIPRVRAEIEVIEAEIERLNERLGTLDSMPDAPHTRERREALRQSLLERRRSFAEEIAELRGEVAEAAPPQVTATEGRPGTVAPDLPDRGPRTGVPPHAEHRTMPEPAEGTRLGVRSSVPGRLTLVDDREQVVATDASLAPAVLHVAQPAEEDAARGFTIWFEPAPGHPRGQPPLRARVRLPASLRMGEDLYVEISPPGKDGEAWRLVAAHAAEFGRGAEAGIPKSPDVERSAEVGKLRAELDAAITELERESNAASAVRPPAPPPPPPSAPPPVETRPAPATPSPPTPMPSVAEINQLRKKAGEVWNPPVDVGDDQDFQFPDEDSEPAPAGWAKSEHDPNKLVDLFKPLRLRKGYVLRAYIFRENGNASGVVWAMPENAEFPEPADSPTLEHHLFKAPKPWDALDDLMEAIEGDESQWSYLAASVLRRELREFGASWHGIDWGAHVILEDDPWKKPPAEDDFPPSRPTTPANQWKWSAARPQHWAPTVRIEPGQVTITYYTFTAKAPERIYRHTETYRPGRYRAKVQDQLIGQGKGGFLF